MRMLLFPLMTKTTMQLKLVVLLVSLIVLRGDRWANGPIALQNKDNRA